MLSKNSGGRVEGSVYPDAPGYPGYTEKKESGLPLKQRSYDEIKQADLAYQSDDESQVITFKGPQHFAETVRMNIENDPTITPEHKNRVIAALNRL